METVGRAFGRRPPCRAGARDSMESRKDFRRGKGGEPDENRSKGNFEDWRRCRNSTPGSMADDNFAGHFPEPKSSSLEAFDLLKSPRRFPSALVWIMLMNSRPDRREPKSAR